MTGGNKRELVSLQFVPCVNFEYKSIEHTRKAGLVQFRRTIYRVEVTWGLGQMWQDNNERREAHRF